MTDLVRELVMAAHRDLDEVKRLVAEHPDLIDEAVEWRPQQTETSLQAASHIGRRDIAEFLLENGAKPNMVVYAMLGDEEQFNAMLADDPDNINEIGAHNFSLMFHAALGGNLNIIETIHQQAESVNLGQAVHAALMGNQPDAVKWLIAHDAPLDSTDFRGRTPLQTAVENEDADLIVLFKGAIGEGNLEVCPNSAR
ncbi:MAG: ankyrin repeat domain-containing protein [Chloroflexota bacterium]